MKTRLSEFLVAIAFTFGLSAFVTNALAEPAPVIRFGALAELTGPGAMNGAACQSGYKAAFELFKNDHPEIAKRVEIIYGDHRRDQKAAISEFQRLSDLGVWGVACNHSIVGVAINPLSKRDRIPLFGVMGHESFVSDNPYAFRAIPTPVEEGGGLAQMAYQRGARNAAILLLEDDYILAIGSAFEREFVRLGGRIVYKDSYSESLSDFNSIAARIRNSKPDMIAMTLGFQQFGPAIRRLREQGVRAPIYANYWLSYPQVVQTAGAENVEGSVFVTERSDFPRFVTTHQAIAPDSFRSGVVFRCYTALATALSGLSDDTATKESFLNTLASLHEIPLADGPLSIVEREIKFELEYYVIENGRPRVIDGK